MFDTLRFFLGLPSSSPDSPSLTVLLLFFFLGFAFLAVAPPFRVARPVETPFNSCCRRRAIISSDSTSGARSRLSFAFGAAAERGFAGEEAGSTDSSFLILLKLGKRGFVSSTGGSAGP